MISRFENADSAYSRKAIDVLKSMFALYFERGSLAYWVRIRCVFAYFSSNFGFNISE